MKKFLKWIWYSSSNPQQIGYTMLGILSFSATEIIKVLQDGGIFVPETQVMNFILKFSTIFTVVLMIAGFVRKLVNTFTDTEVVTFTKKKK